MNKTDMWTRRNTPTGQFRSQYQPPIKRRHWLIRFLQWGAK